MHDENFRLGKIDSLKESVKEYENKIGCKLINAFVWCGSLDLDKMHIYIGCKYKDCVENRNCFIPIIKLSKRNMCMNEYAYVKIELMDFYGNKSLTGEWYYPFAGIYSAKSKIIDLLFYIEKEFDFDNCKRTYTVSDEDVDDMAYTVYDIDRLIYSIKRNKESDIIKGVKDRSSIGDINSLLCMG